eukprot:CAMPEP_0113298164 /NCGR_PEP_ID=MMETSP0010_2-20120614/724_1 /TAXON_ID=216773 ORGANISM="Corethron hystrix, Strain 308" /NCGR_SAMPLE_ID=MMETSP0010_2 /ASSEMBLY_ACC=CAM_ASM_000155 /LENGTH=187 /DNA_ID=CAMNT_0000151175 /DNA_START=240 /DNA_END=803 /DNA_ORIENTATION=+ /assembly_acc=CAM_ASM_000155
MPTYYLAWRRSISDAELGDPDKVFPEERFYALGGLPIDTIFETLICEAGKNGVISPAKCVKTFRRHAAEVLVAPAPPVECVIAIAKRFHGRVPMAVASSGLRDHITSGLSRIGALGIFDAVVTGDDPEVLNGKPAPDIFLTAARRIKVSPDQCVGLEDSGPGLEAIMAAGYAYGCDVRKLRMYPRNL